MNGHAHFAEAEAKLNSSMKRPKKDRTAFGLALYALSSCFLATMLVFAKRLGDHLAPESHHMWWLCLLSLLVLGPASSERLIGLPVLAHGQALVEAEVRVMQGSGASLSLRCCWRAAAH